MTTHATAESSTAAFPLSTSAIENALRDGFLVVEDVCPADELARIAEDYDYLFANEWGKEEGRYFDLGGTDEDGKQRGLPQILGPTEYMTWLDDSVYFKRLASIAQQLFKRDEPSSFQGSHAILKPAGYGLTTPWHQDKSYWGYGSEHFKANYWMPLQDATIESGCLHYIPGSHLHPGQDGFDVVEHQPINNDPRIHGMEVTEKGASAFDMDSAVATPVKAGGVVIHFPRSMHYAGPNLTTQDRRALICGFGYANTFIHDTKSYPWQEKQNTLRMQRQKEFHKQGA